MDVKVYLTKHTLKWKEIVRDSRIEINKKKKKEKILEDPACSSSMISQIKLYISNNKLFKKIQL